MVQDVLYRLYTFTSTLAQILSLLVYYIFQYLRTVFFSSQLSNEACPARIGRYEKSGKFLVAKSLVLSTVESSNLSRIDG
jgi:hypothetical protein